LGLGVGPEVVLRAQAEGLIEFGPTVRFTHPLVRSAVWRGMNAVELREVHRVLAEVADPARAPDRRAWHRAHAAAGPDDGIARELMSSADLAGARGGPSAAAAFLERASALTGPGYEIVTVDDRRGSSRACAAITS
jgi:hypothetical protein